MDTGLFEKSLFSNIDKEILSISNSFKISHIPKYYYTIKYGFHAKINNNKLTIVKDFGSFQSRNINTIAMIEDVLKKYSLPNTELLINTDDKLKQDIKDIPIFTMAKRKLDTYLTYPDHTFYKWKEAKTDHWDKERNSIIQNCKKHPKKIQKVLFRGANTHYIRDYLAKQNNHVLDIKLLNVNQKNPPFFVKLQDHCKWKYLLHIPGISYAARLKYLMMTNSLVFYIKKNPEFEYREFWYGLLQNMYNCVIIKDNNTYNNNNKIQKVNGKWDDSANKYIMKQILDYINILQKDDLLYTKIVNNNQILRAKFTYNIVLEYWYSLITKYSEKVQLSNKYNTN